MASDQSFVDYVCAQLEASGPIVAKKMFGEYTLYNDTKFIGMVSDNKLFIRPTEEGRAYIGNPTEAPPYPGAKLCFLIEDKLDDHKWLCGLINVSMSALPEPKPKKKKQPK